MLGLQRAFQVSGARTTLTSLWQVPDRATRLLMERFYRNLWDRKLGKLEALREAQLWMLREAGEAEEQSARGAAAVPEGGGSPSSGRPSPYTWGAFVLSGDWR